MRSPSVIATTKSAVLKGTRSHRAMAARSGGATVEKSFRSVYYFDNEESPNRLAVASPMPLFPPVITATLPSSAPTEFSFDWFFAIHSVTLVTDVAGEHRIQDCAI